MVINEAKDLPIELLVVVAIIGILVYSVVAYNGYTNSAKVSISKSNHNTVVKKLNLLIQECHLSLNGKVNLKMSPYDKEYEKGCWYDVNTFRFFTDYFPTHLNNIEWKNNHTKEPWENGVAGGSSNSWGVLKINILVM